MYIDQALVDKPYMSCPPDDIDPKKKDEKDWNLNWARHIASMNIHQGAASFCNDRLKFRRLRLYAEGMQDKEQYMDILLGKKKQGETIRKAYMNINWDIFSVLPKFRSVVMGMFMDAGSEISANAISESAISEKEEMKWGMYFDSQNQQLAQLMNALAGLNIQPPPFIIRDVEELNLLDEMGAFKLKLDIAMEQLLKHISNLSEKDEIKQKLIGDFFDINIAITRDEVDPFLQQVKNRYIDPERLIVLGGEPPNYEKAYAFGYYRLYTVSEFRSENPHLSEDDIHKLVRNYAQFEHNYVNQVAHDTTVKDLYTSYAYDGWVIPVLECEMLTIDSKYIVRRKNKYGYELNYPGEFGQVINTEKKKTSVVDMRVWRKTKWVMGSDYVWDSGLQHDMPRPKKSEVLPSYHIYQIAGKSKTELVEPLIDSMQLTWLRYQNLKATGRFSGISIEWTALQNIKLKGEVMAPMELVKMYFQNNVMIYKATTMRGQYYNPSSGKPVDIIPSGINQDMAAILQSFQTDLQLIREFTGITEIASGTDINPEVGLGMSKLSIGATTNALKHINHGYNQIIKSQSLNNVLRLQMIAKGGYVDEYYEGVIGKAMWHVIKISSEKSITLFGFEIENQPSEQEKTEIQQVLERALLSQAITVGEYFYVKRKVMAGGNLTAVQTYMAFKENQHKIEAARMQEQNMMMNTQMGLQIEDAKKQAEMAISRAKQTEETRKNIITEGSKAVFAALADGNEDKANKIKTEMERMLAFYAENSVANEMIQQQLNSPAPPQQQPAEAQ